ncbi:hypothetical protein [Methylobacterium komagatae]
MAITAKEVIVDSDVYGENWTVSDRQELVEYLAVIALGQAQHAARIIRQLESRHPAISIKELYSGARSQMRIKGATDIQKDVSRYHRDGFLFECISWVVAQKNSSEKSLLKDPHLSSTSQGLDGLLIEMDDSGKNIVRSVIFEDKCTDAPRSKFRDEVLPAFAQHHEHKRCRELVANAVSLMREIGINGTDATKAAAAVLDRSSRSYRVSLTVGDKYNSEAKRKSLFKGYNDLNDIQREQRIGALFSFSGSLRDWFQTLAEEVIDQLDNYEASGAYV